MRSNPTAHRSLLAGAFAAMLLALTAASARAGEYVVANCLADSANYSTRPFEDFAARGTRIRRACDPEGPGCAD